MVNLKFIKTQSRLLQILGSFITGLSIGVAIITLLCSLNVIDLNPKQYAYIDVEKVIASVNESLNTQTEKNKISESEVSDKLILAKNKFDLLLKDYVKQHNAIIFSSVKAIAGAKDETEYFVEKILLELK
tara:strand:+ start:223 stop:612 length:390 start_codon:yes stop_codon:yes gene_type:complete